MRSWYRRFKQDLKVLTTLFPWRVGLALLMGTGLLALVFQWAYLQAYAASPQDFSYLKAIYAILNMATFQISYADMPPGPKLDGFFILVPLVSTPLLLIFGANLLHVVRVFFVRRERGQMWQRALAATVERPIVVLGLGHIGYRVANELLDLRRPVIGLDNADSPLVQSLIDREMPVILGDARDRENLESAGVARAAVVVACTYDDLVNIEAAFHVRELNRDARVVLRLFDDDLFGDVRSQFQVEAILSRSAIAAQAFAYAALGVEALESFNLHGETYVLAEIPITATSPLVNRQLQHIATEKQVTIVCLYRDSRLQIEPNLETFLRVDDLLFVFTPLDRMALLTNRDLGSPDAAERRAVLVCGLGHTGYRVVKALHALDHPVVALDFEPSRLAERLQELGIPTVYGDFRRPSILEKAGIAEAEALVACTEDDMVNVETGMRARTIAPGARIVMRIFEEPLGEQIEKAFDIDAVYSTSSLAVPAFIASALDIHLTQPVRLGERTYHMARITLETLSGLFREPIASLNAQEDLTVLLHKRDDDVQIPPHPRQHLRSGDEIVVLANRDRLRELSLRNRGTRNVH